MSAPTPSQTPPPTSQPPLLGPTLSTTNTLSPPSKSPIDFSPPLIAMVIVAAAAFLFITFSRHLSSPLHHLLRRHRHRRRRLFPPPSPPPPPPPPLPLHSSDQFYLYSPYGLDDSVIKTIPLTIYNLNHLHFRDCAVCLLDFQQGDTFRTLPHCSHSFHVDCIDLWLRSHATCPLCRSSVYFSPPHPLESSPRLRPSFDEGFLLESFFLEITTSPPPPTPPPLQPPPQPSPDYRDFLLKRSYSFGFERSFPSEDVAAVSAAATTPYHRHRERRRFFWTKRASSTPFSSLAKSRVFSFRRNNALRCSPGFFRRRGGFNQVWESSGSFTVGSSSSRRVMMMKTSSSPLFGGRGGVFSSSRMRTGDPEALISPERYNRR